ncbi:MAG: hypothetical protein ACR2LX_03820 [Jatrophihabitans sp.]
MSLAAKLRRAPMRVVTGAYIVNSGIGKFGADEDTAKQLHGMASGTYGFLDKVDPKLFAKGLAAGEVAVGSALLLPFVSPVVAGLGLATFSGALLNMYWNTEGLHEPGDPRPTQAGIPISKDVWMFGIGTGLIVDGLLSPAHDKKVELAATVHEKRNRKGKQSRKTKKAAKKARDDARAHAIGVAKETQADLNKRAVEALRKAQQSDTAKKARKASEDAAKRLADAREEYAPIVAEKAKNARSTAADLYDQYAPVVAEKAKTARSTATDLYGEYAPAVADKAKQARATATDLYGEYAPVVADKADKVADKAAKKLKQSKRQARRSAKRAKKAAR